MKKKLIYTLVVVGIGGAISAVAVTIIKKKKAKKD